MEKNCDIAWNWGKRIPSWFYSKLWQVFVHFCLGKLGLVSPPTRQEIQGWNSVVCRGPSAAENMIGTITSTVNDFFLFFFMGIIGKLGNFS